MNGASIDGPARAAAQWLQGARDMPLPNPVIDAARTTLIDWFACTLGALQEPVVTLVDRRVRSWSPTGSAILLTGGRSSPAFAALLHSTAAHVYDFDDTHIWTDAHFSGPTWAAVLAQAGGGSVLSEEHLCRAFVAGFEVGAKLGGRRLGHAMVHRGFQATGLLGRISSAAACTVLAGLDETKTAMALALAATQTGGLTGSFGTMSKPFQAGKTAFDGVIAAELAADGFTAAPSIFKAGGGLARAVVQDGFAEIAEPDFHAGWEILRNSTKAYPCLHGIHPTIDAGRELAPRVAGRDIARVRVLVGPSVPKIARFTRPSTAYEGKFSIAYCAAIALLGRRVVPRDFGPDTMRTAAVSALLDRIEVIPTEGRKMIDAAMEVTLATGELLTAEVSLARGHPGRPLTPDELKAKFHDLIDPVLGDATEALHEVLQVFPAPGSLSSALALIDQEYRPAQ